MTIEELQRSSLNDLKKKVQKLNKLKNQRVRRFESSEYKGLSKPINVVKEKSFNVKNKTLNQLRNMYTELMEFMKTKTSTVRGFERQRKQVFSKMRTEKTTQEMLEEIKKVPEKEKEFWKTYNQLIEIQHFIKRSKESTQIQNALRRIIYENKEKEIIKEINKWYQHTRKKIIPKRRDEWIDEWGNKHRFNKNSKTQIFDLMKEYERVIYESNQMIEKGKIKWSDIYGGNSK